MRHMKRTTTRQAAKWNPAEDWDESDDEYIRTFDGVIVIEDDEGDEYELDGSYEVHRHPHGNVEAYFDPDKGWPDWAEDSMEDTDVSREAQDHPDVVEWLKAVDGHIEETEGKEAGMTNEQITKMARKAKDLGPGSVEGRRLAAKVAAEHRRRRRREAEEMDSVVKDYSDYLNEEYGFDDASARKFLNDAAKYYKRSSGWEAEVDERRLEIEYFFSTDLSDEALDWKIEDAVDYAQSRS